MPASAFAIEIGELIPSGIFLLLALVLPFVFYHVGGGFLHRLQKHLPEWLCILTESYLKPLAWALRQTLFFAAVAAAPCAEACDGGRLFGYALYPAEHLFSCAGRVAVGPHVPFAAAQCPEPPGPCHQPDDGPLF